MVWWLHTNNPGKKSYTGGNWSRDERRMNINCLELKAAMFPIQAFGGNMTTTHAKLKSDNSTTVTYINNLGGTKLECNAITRSIWLWCYDRNIWVTAAHLPGKLNAVADCENRSIHDNMEWQLHPQLHPDLFAKLCEK